MSQTLDKLKEKYPDVNFKHEPQPDCPRCHGKGEYMSGLVKLTFCFCTFISHEFTGITHEIFNDMARGIKPKRG